MTEGRLQNVDKYLITLRIIQPARIQEILAAYREMWGLDIDPHLRESLVKIHDQMRKRSQVVNVRRGTYILTQQGIEITTKLGVKERILDNARLFLMKKQRKKYHGNARRFG